RGRLADGRPGGAGRQRRRQRLAARRGRGRRAGRAGGLGLPARRGGRGRAGGPAGRGQRGRGAVLALVLHQRRAVPGLVGGRLRGRRGPDAGGGLGAAVEFLRLRLSGFKSFVDPAEVLIEPGLTGVVGPNGCGKSNVLEALRWVMGANSAKAMRGQGMDDVIFAGAAGRPSRNHAEVTLTIDNAARRAPQPFTDAAVIEVSRRIDRGAGSTYRVNGKEVRARDVQLLFADASTGANSPALVRQGQISELIAAKPQNRRRILEEAGGVSGLHTRRHEAELRLRAAETNLSRLEDIARELETQLGRLKREARQAEKDKKIAAEIRALQSALLYARWADARNALQAVNEELSQADRAVEDAARAAAAAATTALTAAEKLKPAREEDAVAAALLHRMT